MEYDPLEKVIPHGKDPGLSHGHQFLLTLLVYLGSDPRLPSEELDHADDVHH